MNPRSQCMLTVFDGRQELMENLVIVCLYVSEQLIICMLTQLSEAGKALTQIPSAYELFDDPLATSFATLVQKSESCGRCIDEF